MDLRQESSPSSEGSSGVEGGAVSSSNSIVQEIPVLLELALIRNLAVLQQYNLASAEDCSRVAAEVRVCWEQGRGADPIEGLARLRVGEGEMLAPHVETISQQMVKSLPYIMHRVPFASRFITPTSFYEKYPHIEQICRLMMVPVTFAEDLDVIGVTSINPFFADTLVTAIADELKDYGSVKPIVSAVRLDYLSWAKMCEKHFR